MRAPRRRWWREDRLSSVVAGGQAVISLHLQDKLSIKFTVSRNASPGRGQQGPGSEHRRQIPRTGLESCQPAYTGLHHGLGSGEWAPVPGTAHGEAAGEGAAWA